ncbi:ISAs1 family transposase [Paraburkholderia sediminicola]
MRGHIPLEHGIPFHDTFGRVFAGLNLKQFEECFIRWMGGLCPALAGQVVAIGGKTVRGSRQRGERAIHLVSAYGSGLDMALCQVRTAEKSNEITAIPELLDALKLKGAIVTIDAMGCQREIAERIVQAGADYVLACKGNQGTMLERVQKAFDSVERVPQAYIGYTSEHREVEKDHGRIETRRCVVSDMLTRWQHEPDW